MAAEVAASGGATVVVFDRMPSVGRKLLLAGRGGLNLTHGEPFGRFVGRYGAAQAALRPALEAFSPDMLRAWSATLGQPTIVGSSGRVFPASFKTSPLLRAWLKRLDGVGVTFRSRHHWTGWDLAGALLFEGPDGDVRHRADATVLALGGASWPHLGSDGGWTGLLAEAGVGLTAFKPSNCGFTIAWSDIFRDRHEGQPIKNVALSFGAQRVRGDAVVTRAGLEGGAVYAISAPLRNAIAASGNALLQVSLRPDLTADHLASKFAVRRGKQTLSTHLRKALHLAPVAIGLMHEAALATREPLAGMSSDRLAAFVNAVPLRLSGTAPLARAISSAGGVTFDSLDETFMLRRRPGTFVAGEMLDWEAPTGGYLLQGAFATGAAAGRGALAYADLWESLPESVVRAG